MVKTTVIFGTGSFVQDSIHKLGLYSSLVMADNSIYTDALFKYYLNTFYLNLCFILASQARSADPTGANEGAW